jgi:uncharacterized protein (DUF486 family)
MRTVLLLIASNVFMTIAWYGHLKYKQSALWKVILASWCIAFFEYCLQVPANRWGHSRFSAPQLKILQEAITLVVFTGFAVIYLRESMRWNYIVAYVLIIAAVGFAFFPNADPTDRPHATVLRNMEGSAQSPRGSALQR